MKKIILLGAITLLALAVTACQDSNNKKYDNNYSQSSKDSDRAITDQIQSYLKNNSNLSQDARDVKVTAKNGTVTLKGRVASQNELQTLVNYAQQVSGVNSVDAQLDVRNY